MQRCDVDSHLSDSWERPEVVRDLKRLVGEIEASVPGPRTKEMMYELVDIVLEVCERVRDLETRLGSGVIKDDLRRKEDILVVSSRRACAKPRRDPQSGAKVPTTAGTDGRS